MRAIWAIVPIKDLSRAKQRLSGLLSETERRALGLAMLEDVLTALRQSRALSGILVVTGDRDAESLSHDLGARILPEPDAPGLNPAVASAVRLLAQEKTGGACIVHGDAPLMKADEIDRLAAVLDTSPAMAIAPDAAGGGSNGLALSPPDLISFRYGANSFQRHLQEAAARGITPHVLQLPGLAFDIDAPDQLFTLAAAGGVTRAQEFLRSLRLESRTHRPAQSVR
jgi:2-phospho-L-lactate/phosphoenolpyruvate guanylyltransferase